MKNKEVIYKGQSLTLTRFWGNKKLCLWIKNPNQRDMPKMEFVGGYGELLDVDSILESEDI